MHTPMHQLFAYLFYIPKKLRLTNIFLSFFSNCGDNGDVKQTNKQQSLYVVEKAFLQLHTSSSNHVQKNRTILCNPQNGLFRVMGGILCFDNTFYSRKRRKYLCLFPLWLFGSVSMCYVVVWLVCVVIHLLKLFICTPVDVVFIHSCFLYSAAPVADLIKYAAHLSKWLEGLMEQTEMWKYSIKKIFPLICHCTYIYFCCIKILLLIYLS